MNVVNPRELPEGLFYFPDFPMSDRLIDKIEKVLTDKGLEMLIERQKVG